MIFILCMCIGKDNKKVVQVMHVVIVMQVVYLNRDLQDIYLNYVDFKQS